MSQFLNEIDNTGCCNIEKYHNIYAILNRLPARCKSEGIKKGTKEKKNVDIAVTPFDISHELQIIELMRLQFATKYYIITNNFEAEEQQSFNIKMRR